jgi:SAM-dependent methyltransferase
MRFEDLSFTALRDLAEVTTSVAAASVSGIFTALAERPAPAREVADRLQLDPRAVGILLPVLEELGLLERGDEGFLPTRRAREEFVERDSPAYSAGGLELWLANLQAWTQLPGVLRSGRPISRAADGDEEEGEEDRKARLEGFMAGMAAAPKERVRRLADLVLERHPGARTLLDLGGGPGHISREFCRRGVRVTLLDLPDTVEFVRERYGLDEVAGLETVGADFLQDPLPEGPFDVVLLSNVLHMLDRSACRELIGKVGRIVSPGGIVAVTDFIRGVSPRAGRFALVMLLRTEGGDTYTMEEHAEWFEAAGFGAPELRDLDRERQVLTAAKGR